MSEPSTAPDRVVVLVAAIDARTTVVESLRCFRQEVAGRGEVVLVDASGDGTAEIAEAAFPDLRVLRRLDCSLIPELWREGLLATTTPRVAFSTAAMVPARGWLDALMAGLDASDCAAVGGPIQPSPALNVLDRAVYLHRYLPYGGDSQDIAPGENALYRRDEIEPLSWLWRDGFWEVEVQRALLERGARIGRCPAASITFLGGSLRLPLLIQRLVHARRYGRSRSLRWGPARRLAQLASMPLVPPLLLGRILRTCVRRRLSPRTWMPASLDLAWLLTAWAAGEAAGTTFAPARPAPLPESSPQPIRAGAAR